MFIELAWDDIFSISQGPRKAGKRMPLLLSSFLHAIAATIREMRRPDILSRFPFSKSTFPAIFLLNTRCQNTWSCTVRLSGADRSLDVFLSHITPHLSPFLFFMNLYTTYCLHTYLAHKRKSVKSIFWKHRAELRSKDTQTVTFYVA